MMLYISNFLWLALLISVSGATFRVMTGKGKGHDVLSFSFALVALVMLGFGGRWMFAPNNMLFLDFMRIVGSILALFLFAISRFYKKWG